MVFYLDISGYIMVDMFCLHSETKNQGDRKPIASLDPQQKISHIHLINLTFFW